MYVRGILGAQAPGGNHDALKVGATLIGSRGGGNDNVGPESGGGVGFRTAKRVTQGSFLSVLGFQSGGACVQKDEDTWRGK